MFSFSVRVGVTVLQPEKSYRGSFYVFFFSITLVAREMCAQHPPPSLRQFVCVCARACVYNIPEGCKNKRKKNKCL